MGECIHTQQSTEEKMEHEIEKLEDYLQISLEKLENNSYYKLLKICLLQIEHLREKGEEEFSNQIEARKDLAKRYIELF